MTSSGRTEIWLVQLQSVAPALATVDERHLILSAEDRARIAQSTNPDVREERIASHRALRVILERFAGREARARPFSRGEHGKPGLAGMPFDFSLAHAGGYALIGVSRVSRIGVDIEREREVLLPDDRRALIEAGAIRLAGRELPSGAGLPRFIAAWTRLEAYAKADGCGMARVLGRVGAVGGGSPTVDSGPQADWPPADVVVHDIPMPERYHAAVCLLPACATVVGDELPVRCLPATMAGIEAVMSGAVDAPQV